MKMYEVTATYITLPAGGVVEITDAQADARAHLLKPLEEKGQYLITTSTGFKKGEVFGYDGHLDKLTAIGLTDESGEQADPILPPSTEPETVGTGETLNRPSVDKTVKDLSEHLKMEVADTLELLQEYGVEAKEESELVPEHVFTQVVTDKEQETE